MGEEKNSKKVIRNITVQDMDLSKCGKYQELNGSWVIWMLLSGIILCFKNLYSGIVLIAISVVIFIIYKRNPKNISATYYNLALDCITKEEMEKAKEALMESIKYNKENKIAHILLSSIYYKEENYLETINNIINSKVLEAEKSKYNYLVGVCYFNIEDYENSIKYLREVKYEKTNPIRYIRDILLAKAYCLNKDYENAFKIFNRISDVGDEYKGNIIEYSYFSGLTYLRVGEKEKAAKELRKVYEADSTYMEIENLIKEIN
jgi:hypothetical protein